ncbi:MAG: hypothetical protein ACKOFI_07210, partial [Phycisphaerales bacterium]
GSAPIIRLLPGPHPMNATLFYAAAALGAVVLYLMLEQRPAAFRAALTVSGLAAVGLMLNAVARSAPAPEGLPSPGPVFWLHVLLAFVAVAGAARMVTHPRPVYAALYFVLVILAAREHHGTEGGSGVEQGGVHRVGAREEADNRSGPGGWQPHVGLGRSASLAP